MDKKIIYVLSGGSARGLAHLGVLDVLEKEGIKPSVIIGTSMGALIGGLYAAGISLKELEKTAKQMGKLQKILLFTPIPQRDSLLRLDRVEKLLKEVLGKRKIENLEIPFYAVACDLERGKKVVLHKGNLVRAIRASIAIPGLFAPVKWENKILVDGGAVDPLSIDVALKLKGKIIVSNVVLPQKVKFSSSPGIIAVVRRSLDIAACSIANLSELKDEKLILIQPKITKFKFFDYNLVQEIIESGRKATRNKLKEIKKFINK